MPRLDILDLADRQLDEERCSPDAPLPPLQWVPTQVEQAILAMWQHTLERVG